MGLISLSLDAECGRGSVASAAAAVRPPLHPHLAPKPFVALSMPLGAKDLVAVSASTDPQFATQPFVPLCIGLVAQDLATIAATTLVALLSDHLLLDGPIAVALAPSDPGALATTAAGDHFD